MDPRKVYNRYLTDDGLDLGTSDMSVNGSITPVPYWAAPTARVSLQTLTLFIRDGGPLSADNFAGTAGALTNGLTLKVLDSGDNELVDLMDGKTIKSNADIYRAIFNTRLVNFGAGDDFIVGELSFANTLGGGLTLEAGDKLEMIVQDDLSAVVEIEALVEGELV